MGRVFVITGGGTGLGRAMARHLADGGDLLVLLGRRLDKVQAVADEIGNGSWAWACDVSDPGSVDAAFAEIARRHDRIDGLINNAAFFRPALAREVSNAEIDATIDTDLKGPIHCTRAAFPLLRRGGVIVNVGSETVASRVAMLPVYQSAKQGLERYTRALREEMLEQGIRVTLLRACKMMDEDFEWNLDAETGRKFAEENAKRAIVQRNEPIASFDSAGAQIRWIVNLPDDVSVPEVFLKARFP